MQLCSSLSILWHCLSLGLEWKLTFSSPVATAEFSKFLHSHSRMSGSRWVITASWLSWSWSSFLYSSSVYSCHLFLISFASVRSLPFLSFIELHLLTSFCCYGLFAKLCLTLYDPMDCSLTGSSVHGISQARIVEWSAISFSGQLSNPGIKSLSPAREICKEKIVLMEIFIPC